MARQVIDVGTFPNSRDGDKLRDAVIKINANTEELYSQNGSIYGLLDTKVDKVSGETLTPNKFTDADKLKLDSAETATGAQAKADAAEAAAKVYADTGDDALQLQINSRALVTETGYALTADQATATIYLRDKNGNELDSLSVGFLNNEGTTLAYNSETEVIEIKNDVGVVLSSIPTSSFVTNIAGNLNLNGATLELRDSSNVVLSQVTFNISNVTGLQTALDSKETIVNVDTKVATAETNAIDWVKQFGIGTTVTTYEGDLNTLTEGGLIYAGTSALNKPNTDNGWVIHQPLDTNNCAQIFMSSSGMFTRTEIAGVFSAWDQKETVAGAQNKADIAESNAIADADMKLSQKVDKVTGMGLSQESFTTTEKTKLSTAESVSGAQAKADAAEAAAKSHADTGDAALQSQIDSITTGDGFVDTTSNETIGGIKTFTNDANFEANINVTGSISEGGVALSSKYETPTGAQTKADTAKSDAIAHADSGLSTKVDKVAGKQLSTEDFTTTHKTKLESLESDKYYQHIQALPASVWTIDHPLDKYPSVTVTDSAGTMMIGLVEYPSRSQVVVTFNAGFSGHAELN